MANYIIAPRLHKQAVAEVFKRAAPSYEPMNELMSLGLHRWWRRAMVAAIPSSCRLLLDVAGGKGDIASRFILKNHPKNPTKRRAVVVDPSFEMIKAASSKHPSILAPAEALPFEANSFDAVTMAFGIRNVTHKQKALAEVHRVLKPYGKFICLELGSPRLFSHLHKGYLKHTLPRMARLMGADVSAYKYLADSILKFETPAQLCRMLTKAGFSGIGCRSFQMGIASIYSGYK